MIDGLGSVLIPLAALAAIWLALILVLLLTGRRVAAREVAAFVPNMLLLFRGLIADPRVPIRSKVLLVAAALWLASPIDLIPEFIPIVGPLDDAIVAVLVLRYVMRRTGREVVRPHWRGDPRTFDLILRLAGIPDP